MFKTTSSIVITGEDAIKTNLKNLLLSEKGGLFGDPFFGVRLKRYMFDQNNYVLKDILIDEMYTQIALFMPQLYVERNDITIKRKRGKVVVNIRVRNRNNFTTNMYSIVLFDEEE